MFNVWYFKGALFYLLQRAGGFRPPIGHPSGPFAGNKCWLKIIKNVFCPLTTKQGHTKVM